MRRWVPAVAVVALLGVSAVGYAIYSQEPEESFCTADALIGPNGEMYGRRMSDCQYVDDDGNLVTEFSDGRELCYVVPTDSSASRGQAADCDNPGPGVEVRRPG